MYDQLNRAEYDDAKSNGLLIIREFQATSSTSDMRSSCATLQGRPCDDKEIFQSTSKRKIVALDYVDKLNAAGKLTFVDFAKQISIVYTLAMVALISISQWLKAKPFAVFCAILALFAGVILSVGLALDLPHKNVKFYTTVGSAYAILLPVMDYVHRVAPFPDRPQSSKDDEAFAKMLELAHKRWTQVLGVGLIVVVTLAGTVSFKIVDYHAATFGESFVYYPLLGVLIALGVGLAGFLWGILRGILHMLMEIEACMCVLNFQGSTSNANLSEHLTERIALVLARRND